MIRNEKTGKQQKIVKKTLEKNKKTEWEAQQEAKCMNAKRYKKKSGQKTQRTTRNGELWSPKICNNNSANIVWVKHEVKQTTKTNKQPK